jgi:hypothetical protein
MKEKKEKVTIVAAWVVTDFEVVSQGRRDLGERPKLREVKVPKAVMWANKGTSEDVEKAKAWARKETDHEVAVLVYPTSEPDPMGRAKRDVLK